METLMRELRQLTFVERCKLKYARVTLKMSDTDALAMGGMTKKEAKDFINSLLLERH